ncbi:unnamed protein product, partial [Brassica oleracea]
GRLFLSSTSGTHIYFDTETALGKEKFDNLKDLKAFAEAIDVVRDKGVAMAVAVAMASAEDTSKLFQRLRKLSKLITFTVIRLRISIRFVSLLRGSVLAKLIILNMRKKICRISLRA